MVPEVYQVFWAGMAAGEFINDAAIAAGSYRKQGSRWLAAAGGVRPRRGRGLRGRCLTLPQREEIALGRARGDSIRAIAALLGRSPSTVSRELRRNADGLGRYRATTAHALAYHRASRPKPGKLLTNVRLRGMVEADLAKKYSPEQIAGRLKVEFPDQPEMCGSCVARVCGRACGLPGRFSNTWSGPVSGRRGIAHTATGRWFRCST
jgi:transposase, IS30 family